MESSSEKVRYLVSDRDRHGNVRHYVRRPGEWKIRLRVGPGHPDFQQAYQAALDAPLRGRRELGTMVYFIRAGEAVKIGLTSDILGRVRALQTGSSLPMIVLLTIPCDRSIETAYHKRFKHLRIGGEWFKADPELTRFLLAERRRLRWQEPDGVRT